MILWYTMLNTPWVGALNMHGIVICKRRFWSIAMTCAAMLSEMSCKCKIIAISDEFDEGVYMATLRHQQSGAAKEVEFMSVSALIESIKSGEI
ncbi:MAG: hypothetical protein ABFS56_25045 [Pseudomonadota bacterium]